MTYPRKPKPVCAHPRCILRPTEGKHCWWHAKVTAGVCDPEIAATYEAKVLDVARRTEMARLTAEIGG